MEGNDEHEAPTALRSHPVKQLELVLEKRKLEDRIGRDEYHRSKRQLLSSLDQVLRHQVTEEQALHDMADWVLRPIFYRALTDCSVQTDRYRPTVISYICMHA